MLTRRQQAAARWGWSLVFAAVLGAAAFGGAGNESLRPGVAKGADFVAFWSAGALLAEGRVDAVYSPLGLRTEQQRTLPARWGYRGLYPPPLYQALEAAQPLGYVRAVQAHLILQVLLLGLGGWWLAAALGVDGSPRWTVAVASGAGPAALMNLLTGQAAGLWLAVLAGGVLLLRRGRPLLAGIVLGLLCAKPQFGFVAALWLALLGQRRALLGLALGGAGLLAASLAWGGTGPWAAWLDFLIGGHLGSFAPLPHRSASLPALLVVPLRAWSLALPLSRALSVLGLAWAAALAVRGAGLAPADPGWPLRAGLVLSALLLSLPHMMDYDAALHGLLLLAALPLARGRERWLLALAFAAPLLGEAARTLHVALIPAILLAVTVRFGWAARGEAAGAR